MAVAARRKSPRRQQAEQVLLAPVNWLEERSGLVGGVRYFLFRNVPSDLSWLQTLGSATLTAFIVQTVTGVILAMYYVPSPDEAYESIRYITNDLTWGWLVRGMHRWGASVSLLISAPPRRMFERKGPTRGPVPLMLMPTTVAQ